VVTSARGIALARDRDIVSRCVLSSVRRESVERIEHISGEDDGLLDDLAAIRPHQSDAFARVLQDSVRRALGVRSEPFKLGRFTVLGPIGGGGMGTVVVAYDPDLDRKIALKILHTRGERGRSEVLREGRALARLRHPAVVTVHEVGVVDDQVFVAMEYVEGSDLRAWLRTARTGEATLALLIGAGRGLAAAHDAGLVHFDVKPENLVVDAAGHARVVDFGLARSIEELAPTLTSSPGSSGTTSRGGTPAYMAPERLAGERGDHRSDQYSYCVTCWEALFGRRPLSDSDPLPGKMSVPPRIVAALRRGLSPDPARRFASMHELVDALARRPARWWLLGLGAAAAVGLAIGAYSVGQRNTAPGCTSPWEHVAATWNDERAAAVEAAFTATELLFAQETRATVKSALDRYADAWSATHARACEDSRVHGIIPHAVYERRLACLEDRRLHLAALVERFAAADAKTVTHALEGVEHLPPIEPCGALKPTEEMFAGDPARFAELLQLRGLFARARAEVDTGRPADAEPLLEDLLARARQADNPTLLSEVLLQLGTADGYASRTDRAIERLDEALATAVAHDLPVQAGFAAVNLYHVVSHVPDQRKAPDYLLTIAEAFSRQAGDPLQLMLVARMNRGNALADAGRNREAYEHLERTRQIAEQHGVRRQAAAALANIAFCHDSFGDFQAAAAALREAIAELEPLIGSMHPSIASLHLNLGSAMIEIDDQAAALRHFDRVKTIIRANYAGDHVTLASAHQDTAISHERSGRQDDALVEYRTALEMYERLDGPQSTDVGILLCNMSGTLRYLGRPEEALPHLARSQAILDETLPPEHCAILGCGVIHGGALADAGRTRKAMQVMEPIRERFATSECSTESLGELELEMAQALWNGSGAKQRPRVLELIEAADRKLTKPEQRARLDKLRVAVG
jgi:serine/threonine protein kinase